MFCATVLPLWAARRIQPKPSSRLRSPPIPSISQIAASSWGGIKTGMCGAQQPFPRLGALVFVNAVDIEIDLRQGILRIGNALFGGFLIIGHGSLQTALARHVGYQQLAVVELRRGIAEIGRLLHQLFRRLLVPWNVTAFHQNQRIFEHRRRIAALGRLTIPERGLLGLAGNTKALREDFGNQRLRCGITKLRPWKGQIHRRKVIARAGRAPKASSGFPSNGFSCGRSGSSAPIRSSTFTPPDGLSSFCAPSTGGFVTVCLPSGSTAPLNGVMRPRFGSTPSVAAPGSSFAASCARAAMGGTISTVQSRKALKRRAERRERFNMQMS